MKFTFLLTILVATFTIFGCSDDKPTGPGDGQVNKTDTIPPAAVANLSILGDVDSTALLSWTAPGDNGFAGFADYYDIRYSNESVVLLNWDSATVVQGPPSPLAPGSVQQFLISGLEPTTTYFFALKSGDTAGNISPISNIVKKPPRTAPSVSMVLPLNGQSVADLVILEAEASDDKGVLAVEFFINAQLEARITSPPYTHLWDASQESHSSNHVIFARAWDLDSNNSNSTAITCTIDTSLGIPQAVTLLEPLSVTDSSATLIWTASRENDFLKYLIQFDTSSANSGQWQTSGAVDAIGDTSSVVMLQDNWQYFFRIVVEDMFGRISTSNTKILTTPNSPPDSVEFVSQSRASGASVMLGWTKSTEYDFRSYDLYMSIDSVVDITDSLMASVMDRASTSIQIIPPDSVQLYYYGIYVTDTSGINTRSNLVKISARPGPSSIISVIQSTNSVDLSWAKSEDQYFDHYEIRLSASPDMQSIVDSITSAVIDFTSATFSNLIDTTNYYADVIVVDSFGFTAKSVVAPFTTRNAAPPTASLLGVANGADSVQLSWNSVTINDFSRYEIFRSVDSTNISNLIASISNKDSTNFIDKTTDSGKVYFYELKVYDSGGLSSSSNVVRVALIKGFALRFDGIDDFVTILSGTTQLLSPSFTIEMWVSWQNTSAPNFLLSRKINEFEIIFRERGTMEQIFTCQYTQPDNTMPSFQWVHLTFSYDAPSAVYKLYLNGSSVYSKNCGTYMATSGDIILGKRLNNTFRYTGYIDELRYWDHARSSTEIMNNYRKFIPTAAGLIGRWSFDEGSGSTFGDVGPSGTISGATWEVSTAPIEY